MAETVVNDADEPTLDAGPLTGRAGSERTCIVNRRSGSPDGLVRFVVGPDGDVVPDVKYATRLVESRARVGGNPACWHPVFSTAMCFPSHSRRRRSMRHAEAKRH